MLASPTIPGASKPAGGVAVLAALQVPTALCTARTEAFRPYFQQGRAMCIMVECLSLIHI
eukprot:7353255-Alexandrium_andersonii.AAC.1